MQVKPRIAVSIGDPAGVGPEVAVSAAVSGDVRRYAEPVLVGYSEHLLAAGKKMQMELKLRRAHCDDLQGCDADEVPFVPPTGDDTAPAAPVGEISPGAGLAAMRAFEQSVDLVQRGCCESLATAPLHKESLEIAGARYADHTGGLAVLTGHSGLRTMFETGSLRVFFVTRHLSLSDAIKGLTPQSILEISRGAARDLARLDTERPRLALAALNPHAGDGGLFGDEEKHILAPAVQLARAEGIDLSGPIPADSVFHLAKIGAYDGVISLYHDQGHIATKTLDFYETISYTFGLPFLRTSVDHGTALDLAGTGRADSRSMKRAILAAARWGSRWT